MRNEVVAIVLVVAILAGAGAVYLVSSYSNHAGTTTTQTTCMTIFPAQPLGASMRVINATSLTPIAGAVVTANAPVSGICGASTPTMDSVQFTTNSTEWYPLPFINHGTYQIAVTYSGHSYGMTMPLGLSVYNCGTLYVPTGQMNVTTTGASQMPCQSIG